MAILTQQEIAQKSAKLQREGKCVVFTNGCFDLLHRGHIEILAKARTKGDYLIVGINGDDSVRRLKGENRPIQSEEDRAIIVDALASVDDVTIFYNDTPKNLIDLIKPNIIVKGTDYEEDEIVGGSEVKSWGGHIVRIPLVERRGTHFIIEKIVAFSQGKKS